MTITCDKRFTVSLVFFWFFLLTFCQSCFMLKNQPWRFEMCSKHQIWHIENLRLTCRLTSCHVIIDTFNSSEIFMKKKLNHGWYLRFIFEQKSVIVEINNFPNSQQAIHVCCSNLDIFYKHVISLQKSVRILSKFLEQIGLCTSMNIFSKTILPIITKPT